MKNVTTPFTMELLVVMFGDVCMKKVLCLLAFCQLLVFNGFAFADCPTGYACLLKDLKQEANVFNSIQSDTVELYFDQKLTEPSLRTLNKVMYMPNYRDILPYTLRYYHGEN